MNVSAFKCIYKYINIYKYIPISIYLYIYISIFVFMQRFFFLTKSTKKCTRKAKYASYRDNFKIRQDNNLKIVLKRYTFLYYLQKIFFYKNNFFGRGPDLSKHQKVYK